MLATTRTVTDQLESEPTTGPRYTARERHSEILSEYWTLVQQKHSTKALPLPAASKLGPPHAARTLPKTSQIISRLALRRVAELTPLVLPEAAESPCSCEDQRSGGAIRAAKATRSEVRAKRASPYAKKPAAATRATSFAVLPPLPPTSALSADLRGMGFGSSTPADGAPTATAGAAPAAAAARRPLRRSPHKRPAVVHESSVVHVGGSEAMRGCGGARGPIQRLSQKEEIARLEHDAQERERRWVVAKARAAEAEGQRHGMNEIAALAAPPRPSTTASACADEASHSRSSLRDLARATTASRAARPILNHRLPPMPKHVQLRIRFKPGFEGLLDSPTSPSPTGRSFA